MSRRKNGNVIKVHRKDTGYTNIDNGLIKNKELSLKAKGLLMLLISLPDNWNFSEAGLTSLSKDGRDSVRSGLVELEEHKYLIRVQEREDGRFFGVTYNVYEVPKLDSPKLDNPISDIPHNKELSNKELNNQLPNNNKDIVESKDGTKGNGSKAYDNDFEQLWKLYPKKQGKPDALRHYKKAIKDGVTNEEIEQGIKDYVEQIEINKTERQFIKLGSTWFSKKGWEDEYDTKDGGYNKANKGYESVLEAKD